MTASIATEVSRGTKRVSPGPHSVRQMDLDPDRVRLDRDAWAWQYSVDPAIRKGATRGLLTHVFLRLNVGSGTTYVSMQRIAEDSGLAYSVVRESLLLRAVERQHIRLEERGRGFILIPLLWVDEAGNPSPAVPFKGEHDLAGTPAGYGSLLEARRVRRISATPPESRQGREQTLPEFQQRRTAENGRSNPAPCRNPAPTLPELRQLTPQNTLDDDDLRGMAVRLSEECGLPPGLLVSLNNPASLHVLRVWTDSGYSWDEDVVPTIRNIVRKQTAAQRRRGEPLVVSTFNYFTREIARSFDRRRRSVTGSHGIGTGQETASRPLAAGPKFPCGAKVRRSNGRQGKVVGHEGPSAVVLFDDSASPEQVLESLLLSGHLSAGQRTNHGVASRSLRWSGDRR